MTATPSESPSVQDTSIWPCGDTCDVDAEVIPPSVTVRGIGWTRNRRQVGSSRCNPATYRCRNEITAPLE